MLDAQTKTKGLRVSAFGSTLSSLMDAFALWAETNLVTPEDMWYADVFEDEKHIASFSLEGDGCVVASAAPENSTVNPYKRGKYHD